MKNIFITGGSRGIGKELVYKFANTGNNVFFTYNSSEADANKIVTDLQSTSRISVYAIKCDLSEENEVKRIFKENKSILSNIDILINNAGITGSSAKQFMLTGSQEWWKVMHTNLGSVLNCTRAILPIMLRNKHGRIINVTSLSGIKGNPGQSAYSASKSAISAFSKSLSKELKGSGIVINCLAPGFIETEMTSNAPAAYYNSRLENSILQRMGTTKEIANIIHYLAIEAPSYLINQEILIDGGIA
ncbi:SDR family NAD(P)-dependent oxidoreductase [Parabacteroides sp. BX2]|uniref:SDR family NAD(P)-dependent oxidoreductase n=1 Tax=Parabacteroides segnis TaxID=2763058 RepID=A0ABR7DY66_9BACT|nr:SDR family NAD(P)-dependent oxidoreductase [Parabacteroides segnis]MBC5641839.1 SDR family NAD(P)-dependent oxidoreductase [Parabacteroides segnis]